MPTKQDIELALRASDTTTKKTFDAAKQAVDGLVKSVRDSVGALESGDVSAGKLAGTLDKLKSVGTSLANQQGLIEQYKLVSERLADAQDKAQKLREDANRLAAAQAAQATVTRSQASELAKLERAAASAEKSVNGLQRQSETYGAKLTAAGIGTDNLAAATAKIGVEANRVGTAIRAVSTALENFDTIQEGVARNAAAGAAVQEAATRKKNAALLAEQAFIADATTGLRELAAAEKQAAAGDEAARITAGANAYERFEAAAKRAAAAERDRAKAEQEANAQQQALGQFRQIAEDALAADRSLSAFATAESQASAATVTLKDGLTALLQPSEQAYKTLDGLEGKVTEIVATIGEAEKPFANYQQQLIELGRAQGSILNTAGKIDAFRAQADVVELARSEFAKQSAQLETYAASMKAADAPSAELVRGLRQQEAALAAAGKAVGVEEARLAELSASLKTAKVDTNDLVGAENRLKETAGSVAAAQARLQKASEGNKGGAFAFLGLSPYALTNLGYQVNDVVTQLASGTKIEQVFAQQGGQILQIFPGIFSQIAGLLPIIAVAGAAFAGLFFIIKRAFDQQATIKQFSGQLAASADGAKYAAGQLTEVTDALTRYGVKLEDARAITAKFVQQGIDPARLVQFGKAAQDVATVTGEAVPQAAGELAAAFTKGYDAVAQLDDKLHFLTTTQRENIRAQFEAGDADRARAEAFGVFTDKFDGAAKKARGEWHDAFRSLGNAFKDFLDYEANGIGINFLIQKLGELADAADKAHGKLEVDAAGNVHFAAPGPNGPGPNGGKGDGSSFTGDESAPTQKRVDDTRDLLARLAVTEDASDPAAILSVVRNRSIRSGQALDAVATAPGQFNGLANVDKVDRASAAYKKALAAFDQVIVGGADTVNRAVNFYSPAAQAALAKRDGRSVTEGQGALKFAQPQLLAATDPNSRFFRGTFPGDRGLGLNVVPNGRNPAPSSVSSSNSNAVNSQLSDYVKQLGDALVEATRDDPAELRRKALEDARAEIERRGGNPSDTNNPQVKQALDLALATVNHSIEAQQRELSKTVGAQLAAFQKQVESGQVQDLPSLLKAIRDYAAVQKQSVSDAKFKGLQTVNISGVETSVTAATALIDKLTKVQEITVSTGFYEKQLADLTSQRGDAIAKINADLSNGLIQPKDAIATIGKVTADFQPRFAKLASDAHSLRDGLKDAKPDPALLALLSKVDAAGPNALADGAKQQLVAAENAVNGIVTTRDEALAAIREKISDPDTTGDDVISAYQQAIALQGTYNARILEGARLALQVAQNLKAAGQNTPQNEAAIGKFQGVIAQASKPSATNGTSVGIGNADTVLIEGNINKLIAERNERVTTLNTLEEQGALLDKDRRAQTQAIFAESAPAIQAEIASEQKLLDLRLAQGNIKPADYAAETAKLKLLGTQAQYVDENFTKLRTTIIDSLANGGVQAIDSGAEALGNFVAGTESAKDAITDVGRAAVNFFAQFLRDIANALLQMEALQAIKNLPFLNSLTSGVLDTTGLSSTAVQLAGAGTTLAGAAVPLSAVATQLQIAATTLATATAAQQATQDAQDVADAFLLHGGGVVGAPGGQSRQGVSALAFIGAPRYHTGNPGVGLKSDEQAAILQKGEEVLSKDDPRNRNNSRGGKGGGGAPNVQFRHVLVQDPADIPKAMAGAQGEQVTITHIKQNLPTIRQLLRG